MFCKSIDSCDAVLTIVRSIFRKKPSRNQTDDMQVVEAQRVTMNIASL